MLALNTVPVGPSRRNVTDSFGVKPASEPPVNVPGNDPTLCATAIVNDVVIVNALDVFALSPPTQFASNGVSVNHHDPAASPERAQLATPAVSVGVHVVVDTGVVAAADEYRLTRYDVKGTDPLATDVWAWLNDTVGIDATSAAVGVAPVGNVVAVAEPGLLLSLVVQNATATPPAIVNDRAEPIAIVATARAERKSDIIAAPPR